MLWWNRESIRHCPLQITQSQCARAQLGGHSECSRESTEKTAVLPKGSADQHARPKWWKELRPNGPEEGEGKAKTHYHEQELRSRVLQSLEKSRAIDLGKNMEPSLGEAAGLGICTIVLRHSVFSLSSFQFRETLDLLNSEFQWAGIISLLSLFAPHSLFSTQKAELLFSKHKSDHDTPLFRILQQIPSTLWIQCRVLTQPQGTLCTSVPTSLPFDDPTPCNLAFLPFLKPPHTLLFRVFALATPSALDIYVTLLLRSGLCSNVTSSERPPLPTYPKGQPQLLSLFSPCPYTHSSHAHPQLLLQKCFWFFA